MLTENNGISEGNDNERRLLFPPAITSIAARIRNNSEEILSDIAHTFLFTILSSVAP